MKYKCQSLGQGTPGWAPPKYLRDSMITAIKEGANQYGRVMGDIKLATKVAKVYSEKMGRELDASTEVIITQGASGALHSFIMSLVNNADEVVMFEPLWSVYEDFIELAGGVSKYVTLREHENDWVFDPEELRAALRRPQAKIFLMTSPHNPCGKVFTKEEFRIISDILDECPHIVVLHDACYADLTFDGLENLWLASHFNNWERTITIFSAGKLLNCTGWRIGWAIGPAKLIKYGGVIATTMFETFQTPG